VKPTAESPVFFVIAAAQRPTPETFMHLSARRLHDAREITAGLLEQLGLDAYLFEVEPRDGPWEVRIECARPDGWQTVLLAVEIERLLDCARDGAERARLLRDWGERLDGCRRLPAPE
jgi:hypothetical protein